MNKNVKIPVLIHKYVTFQVSHYPENKEEIPRKREPFAGCKSSVSCFIEVVYKI